MKTALMIDGGYLRSVSLKAGKSYSPKFIEAVAHQCFGEDEEKYRIYYYDAPHYEGKHPKPVSGVDKIFDRNNQWIEQLAKRDYFAVRLGVVKFRGWKLKEMPSEGEVLTDDHFSPDIQQKGVDMRIGLDVADLRLIPDVKRFIMLAFDTDLIPALKHGRKTGMQAVGIQLPGQGLSREYKAHVDITRDITWPE